MKLKSKIAVTGIVLVILVAGLATVIVGMNVGVFTRPPIHVACVGDSITADTQYPGDLGTLLGDKYLVENFGVGRTTISLDFEKPYLNQSVAQLALKFEPNIVVIMLGTNDAYLSPQERSNFTSDYKTLVDTFQQLSSKPKIFITIPPPVFDNTMGLNNTILEDSVIPLIEQTANELNLPLIDAHTPLINHPEDFLDGVHPNSIGSSVIANQVVSAIIQRNP